MSTLDDEEDVARPIYRAKSQSFMQFNDVSDKVAADATDPDVASDKRSQDDDIGPGEGMTDDYAQLSVNPDTIDIEAVADSVRDQSAYDRCRTRSTERLHIETKDEQPDEGQNPNAGDRLATLVGDLFALPVEDTLLEHYPAWLLKSVLLQGHMFITKQSLCFYSYVPAREDITIKSGYLKKKSKTLGQYVRRWFVLKNDMLSYYESASDLYFPHKNIDLKQALAATADLEHMSEPGFGIKLMTSQQEYYLRADTASAAMEWVKVLQKVIFRLNNDGECVKIMIPLPSILDVEESKVLHFADTIKIRIADDHDSFAINEYYFTLFDSCQAAIELVRGQIHTAVKSKPPQNNVVAAVLDSSKNAPQYHRSEAVNAITAFRDENPQILPNIEIVAQGMVDRHGREQRSLSIGSQLERIIRPRSRSRSRPRHSSVAIAGTSAADKVAPTSTSGTGSQLQGQGLTSNVSRMIGSSMKTVGKIATSAYRAPLTVLQPLQGLLSADSPTLDSTAQDQAIAHTFDLEFGNYQDERLLKSFKALLGRSIPLPGDLYISDERVCYRSSAPGKNIRIVLPLNDVEVAIIPDGPSLSFGFSRLLLRIRAHQDVSFEFLHSADRDQCLQFVNGAIHNLNAMEDHKTTKRRAIEQQAEAAKLEHNLLENSLRASGVRKEVNFPVVADAVDVPPIIFDSPGASLISFKPQKKLRFTCLTIGSRGDVQPYVALCKGLIADGQYAKIATHEEFREFVTGHGIEFVPIDGNPAELMAICVEHGMFTYSFLREASREFRGWIDGLLKSSWAACQQTDVLIESPSAMGGIHIAEALGIPYFRAFTMPWSKTRVYPHAFAVPDHNMGGNYNALTYTAFDNLFWKAISGQVNRWRKKTLNLPATTYDRLAQHKVPFLYNFSPSVVPPARDWHEWIRVTGYWFLDNSDDKDNEKWTPPEKTIAFIRNARQTGQKLVYIGFGSIVVADPKALTKAVIDAVNKAGVKCILVKGWSARSNSRDADNDEEDEEASDNAEKKHLAEEQESHESNEDNPDYGSNILSLDSIPHDWLFPQLDAACHHGGAGSLGASLRAGIPTIVKPFFGDQHFFGSRVQDLGVGICLHSLTVNSLSQALQKCTSDKDIMEKAQKIGEQIRGERGVDNAIESIYRDLEYARSLIKSPHRTMPEGSQSSGESYEVIDSVVDDEDDADLFEVRTDEHGKKFSILRPFKSLRLPNPIGDKYGSYGFSGIKLLRGKGDKNKIK